MFGTTRAILLEHMRTCDKRQATTDQTLKEIQIQQSDTEKAQHARHEENLKSLAAVNENVAGLKVTALWAVLGVVLLVLSFILSQVLHFSVAVGH